MSTEPIPPAGGWTLSQAAAALFPTEWDAADFADSTLEFYTELGDDEYVAARDAIFSARQELTELFRERMRRGDLVAYGSPRSSPVDAPPTMVRPHLWADARPHFDSKTPAVLEAASDPKNGHHFAPSDTIIGLPGGVVLSSISIKKATTQGENQSPTKVDANQNSEIKQPGGRPPTHDWKKFNKETSGKLGIDGGEITKREFVDHMKSWAKAHMSPVPDDSTITRHIADNVEDSDRTFRRN